MYHPAMLIRVRAKNLDVSMCSMCCVPISGFVDMRETFPGTFQDFNFDIVKSEHL